MYSFLYGTGSIQAAVPADASVDTIHYQLEPGTDEDRLIDRALAAPIASPPLHDMALGKKSAVILISDHTRLCPSYVFLPLLVDELNRGGIPDNAIDVIVSLGVHRKMTVSELQALTGIAIYNRVRVSNHSCLSEDCVYLGTSSKGTPLEINRTAASADLLVATGNIEPHRLVGMSGGVKAIIPGVASQRCIANNHGLSQQFQVQPGQPDNPIHRDLEEVLPFLPPTFLLNVIVNHERKVIGAVAGHIQEAHKVGVRQASGAFMVASVAQYDLVIASAGGHPKDMHLYQALKTLQNAAALAKPGGNIILIARCEELFGNGVFQYWVETIQDRSRMVGMLREQFTLGAHKVEHLDKVLKAYTVYLYSDIPQSIVELTGLIPVNDVSAVVKGCVSSGLTRVAVMPYGALTFVQ